MSLVAANAANEGAILFLSGRAKRAKELLDRALHLSEHLGFVRLSVTDTLAQVDLMDGNVAAGHSRLSQCSDLIGALRAPSRSWYDLIHQLTRCSYHEHLGQWREIVAIAERDDAELERRQYRALRTALLSAKARALAALGERHRADQALATAVEVCPRSAVDPLIVIEATRAACAAWSGRIATSRAHFDRALGACRAIGHRYHEHWITTTRDRFDARTSVAVERPRPLPTEQVADVIGDIATLLGAGHAVDLMAHRVASMLRLTTLGDTVECFASGGHEYQPLPSVAVEEDPRTHALVLRASDRRAAVRVARPDTLDSVVLLKHVGDIVRVAVSHAADTEHEGDEPNLWPSTPVGDDHDTVFRSPRMAEILRVAARLADTDIPILITGETGTGKEIIARFIHENSRHRRGPFIPFNSSAVAKDLVESQLFGHRRGAFTGAHESAPGVIRSAERGTLFLDEVGELDLAVQPKLLRFLEQGEIHPVGDPRPQPVKVRLVAATNANLDEASREGRFRRDLFYRLGVARIALPPLRERKDEIPAMASLFLARASRECARNGLRLADDFVAALLLYDWPGNIRELVNEIRRVVAMAADGDVLTAQDLSPDIGRLWRQRPIAPVEPPESGIVVRLDQPLSRAVAEVEEQFIERALAMTGGRVSEAAKLLGLSRKGLFLKRRRRNLVTQASPSAGDS